MNSPLKIEVLENEWLHIHWSDNDHSKISLRTLRKNCPCAICQAEREHNSSRHPLSILSAVQFSVSNISTNGNYALNISWLDGHNTGIYEYDFIKKLAVTE